MNSKTKNVLIWAGVAVAVILVIGVVKKANKKLSVTAAVIPSINPSAVTLPQNPLGQGPKMNNWDGKGGYSYTLSDGSDDYYTKDGKYVSSD